jgi:hypothetical protein
VVRVCADVGLALGLRQRGCAGVGSATELEEEEGEEEEERRGEGLVWCSKFFFCKYKIDKISLGVTF